MNTIKACGCTDGACRGSADSAPVAAVGGFALHAPGQQPGEAALRERAWAELLRQEAVRRGLLPAVQGPLAPELGLHEQQVIEALLDQEVPARAPTDEECRRYYEAHKSRYVSGRSVHARHILFGVTPGVDVHALAVRAEAALLELMRPGTPPGRFAELARELSNCPSGAEGGDLGTITPEDCVDELANELFHATNPLHGMGLHPRLVHSRFGLHIVEVLGRKQGRQARFEDVHGRIAAELAQQSRARGLHQFMQLLVGRTPVDGLDLSGAHSPLVQ